MSQGSPAPPPQVSASPRVRLARLARDAALAVPGVLGAEAGSHGVHVTADPPAGLLHGVSVVAQADGRYEVALRLVARVVPLVALSEEVRHRVQASARRVGLADRLGIVNVEFARLLTPEDAQWESEAAPAAARRGTFPRPSAPAPPAGPLDEGSGR
jgi:hypothetical protein